MGLWLYGCAYTILSNGHMFVVSKMNHNQYSTVIDGLDIASFFESQGLYPTVE